MSLAILATEENWQGFDEAWTRLMEADGPVDEVLEALAVVAVKRRMSRCMALVRAHAERLNAAGRPADAARVLGAALRGGGPVGEVAEPLLASAEAAWGSQEWWPRYCEVAGFQRRAPDLRRAWMDFDDMRSYAEGAVVFHAAGWGTGQVRSVDPAEMEVEVQFQGGKRDRFPLRTAVEIFELLPESDLRAQSLRDPQAVRTRLAKEPLEILRSILLRYGGKTSHVTIRNALMQIGVDGNAWSSWWRRARLAAENSEWFRVSGNAARAEVELLKRAMDPVEGLRRQLQNARDLREALSRVRDILSAPKLEESVRAAALEVIEGLVADPRQQRGQRMAAWMLLREHKGATPPELLARLQEAAAQPAPPDPGIPPPLWALFQEIPGSREQERAATLLGELYGERWLDEAAQHLPHAPAGMVAPLIDALLQAGRGADLARHYSSLLARPLRAPFVLIALARLAEEGRIEGAFPTGVQRAQALIELAVNLQEAKKGNPLLARAHQRLTELLTRGREPLLRKLLAEADSPALRMLRGMVQRGVDEKIDAMVTDIAMEMGPELFRSEELPFWREEKIWTTREGMARRDAELRELRERKLPANAEALAKAASYGDLSENAEWEHAIEEQRHLTEQATAIEREMRQAALLENAPIPEDTVCPGTEVRYREVASGQEHTVVLLGPWDDRANAISYRAPLASGMLGKRTGERAVVELPSGPMEVEILAIETAPLETLRSPEAPQEVPARR
jgi:transcription elongation factor GreA